MEHDTKTRMDFTLKLTSYVSAANFDSQLNIAPPIRHRLPTFPRGTDGRSSLYEGDCRRDFFSFAV
jgi:hypothetical protein